MVSKIITLDELKKYEDFSLGYGHFTTIHPGHIRYLKHAKNLASSLVVALKGDLSKTSQKPRYQFNQSERADALSMLGLVDAILLLNNDELEEVVKVTNPKLLVLGTQFENNPEEEVEKSIKILSARDISVMYHGGDISYFSTELLTTSENEIKLKRNEKFKSACKRQSLSIQSLKKSIDLWHKASLIVIGDSIVDRYVACEALGISSEAPVVVVKELENRDFHGGAAIVASHIKNLGANCKLISVIGDDNYGQFLKKKINSEGIEDGLIFDTSRPTTFKKRYLVENQKLFRVSRLEQTEVNSAIENQLIKELEKSAEQSTGIVISDFVYGVITSKVLEKIHALAKKYDLLLPSICSR